MMTHNFKNLIALKLIFTLTMCLFGIQITSIQAQDQFSADRIMTIAYSPSGDRIAIGYGTGIIKIVNAVSGQLLTTLTGHTATISSLAWNSLGTQLVSGSLNPDATTRLWNVGTGQIIQQFSRVGDDVKVVNWTPNNQQVVVIPSAGDKSVFDVTTGALQSTIATGTAYVVKWSPDNSKIAFPLLYGGIDIRNASNYQNITYLGANSGKISGDVTNQIISLAWKPDNSAVAVGTWGGNVLIWNVTSGQLTFEQRGNDYQGTDRYLSFIKGLRFSADGSQLTSISGNGTSRTWNTTTGQLVKSYTLPSPVYAVDWSPDGKNIAFGGVSSAIQIFSVCPCTLFGSTVPANPSNIGNPPAVNLGVVFKPSVNGQVTGIRFYKLTGNGGTHKGYLWSSTGTQLGNVTFTGETATGWQTATFTTPINVTANTVYVASYHAPQGRFAYDNNTFTTGRTVLPLYALATGETSPGNATNYWVDVVFSPT